MWYGPGGRARTVLTAFAGLACVVGGLLLIRDPASADEAVVVAIDAETTGNSARGAGALDDCVSVSVGERFDVDIVLPSPGVPSTRGVSGYQFQFYYDLSVISVQDVKDDLLAQAPGSNLVPFSDATPNKTGEYLRVVADFGPAGIEPQGASETGPGVIARLTLQAEGDGSSPLGLRDVRLVDDGSANYGNVPVLLGNVHVGSPCPAAQASISPSPAPSATAQPTPTAAAQRTAAPAVARSGGPGLTGGPASGVGVLASGGRGAVTPMIWLAAVVTGILGITGGRMLLKAPARGRTRESLQGRAWMRAVWKRQGNKDC